MPPSKNADPAHTETSVAFTVRLPPKLLERVDELRTLFSERVGVRLSRNEFTAVVFRVVTENSAQFIALALSRRNGQGSR